MPTASVSIIICTRNRASSLQKTLEQLNWCRVPPSWDAEVIVVNNGSTDDTPEVLAKTSLSNADFRYVAEPRKGLSHARNTGLAQARKDIIIFTDDDTLPDQDWIVELASPILRGDCDAATGQVFLDPGLLRPWMTVMHRGWLASSLDAQVPGGPVSLVGANMGFRRSVLQRVPAFDPELGAGALGSGEDTLFGLQLLEAGFRVAFNERAKVIHALSPSRLLRRHWLKDAETRGRTKAYLLYHWYHSEIRNPLLECLNYSTRLMLRRLAAPPHSLSAEGCAPWEMSYVLNMAKCRQFVRERRRGRAYRQRALERIDFSRELPACGSRFPAGS